MQPMRGHAGFPGYDNLPRENMSGRQRTPFPLTWGSVGWPRMAETVSSWPDRQWIWTLLRMSHTRQTVGKEQNGQEFGRTSMQSRSMEPST